MDHRSVQLSAEFKKHGFRAILAIIFFIFSYIVLLTMAILLTGYCIYWSFMLIAVKPMFLTLAIGLGLGSLGVLLVIFLLKFMFTSNKSDRSHLIEITESEQPELFDMISEIVFEVDTQFPKRIYLSREVNAAVFYDSSFWSMLLPVRKNLVIGLGLVNMVTKDELKAILSHEFGHFSQRSMKVGSYVYNVNQVIVNMLYENSSFQELTKTWSGLHPVLFFFVSVALGIIEGIQWLLRKLYDLVNKPYLALSREMEFHADEIAASVTGHEPLKDSLLRMSFVDSCFNRVLEYYSDKFCDNIIAENIFADQTIAAQKLIEVNNLKVKNKLPDISLAEQTKYDKSKLVIKDQWASHPSVQDRVSRLEKTGYNRSERNDDLANGIFKDVSGLQKRVSDLMFQSVQYQGKVRVQTPNEFSEDFSKVILNNSFPDIFKGYYDYKNFGDFELPEKEGISRNIAFEDFYTTDKIDEVYTLIALFNDEQHMKNIIDKSLDIKSFDYDGMRYFAEDAKVVLEQIVNEQNEIKQALRQHDLDVFVYFLMIEKNQNKPAQLENWYNEFRALDDTLEQKNNLVGTLRHELSFLNTVNSYEVIKANFDRLKPREEEFKSEINALLEDPLLAADLTAQMKHDFEKYSDHDWEYFDGKDYLTPHLDVFFQAINTYPYALARKFFLMKKRLLNYKETLYYDATLNKK